MSTALTQTTLSNAVSNSANVLPVASASGITAPVSGFTQQIYVINPDTTRGELMTVIGINGLQVMVSRLGGLFRQAFASGSTVVIGTAPIASPGFGGNLFQPFQESDPVGVVTAAQVQITPWINATNGNQWLRSVDGLWVPGWNNPNPNKGVTVLVSSAAGAIVPSGPLFHVDGTAAITGFTNGSMIGFAGGSFTIIPDANFTWTAAGNIAVLGTAVTNRALTFTWDSNAGKWNPSYV